MVQSEASAEPERTDKTTSQMQDQTQNPMHNGSNHPGKPHGQISEGVGYRR